MFRLKYKHFANLRSFNFLIKSDGFKLFSTVTPAASGPGQVSTAPPKTKEELKIEGLMKQWPEHMKNATKENVDHQLAKDICQDLYKHHQGDKKNQGYYDLPYVYMKKILISQAGTQTTDAVACFLKEFEGFLTDEVIMSKFNKIAFTCPEKTPEFFQVILPQIKKIIINADRQSAPHLATAVASGSALNIADTEFWDMLVLNF
jgi:hypothetical protein